MSDAIDTGAWKPRDVKTREALALIVAQYGPVLVAKPRGARWREGMPFYIDDANYRTCMYCRGFGGPHGDNRPPMRHADDCPARDASNGR